MVEHTPQPLTPAQAKARLRAAATRATPGYWLHRHPWRLLLLAWGCGFIAGHLRLPPAVAARTGRLLLASLFQNLFARQVRTACRKP